MAKIIKAKTAQPAPTGCPAVRNLVDIAAEARSVVLEARREAARITAEARAAADAGCEAVAEKAYAEGFARGRHDGYADGQKQGIAEAGAEFAARSAGLTELAEQILTELSRGRERLIHDARREMLDFALELAERVIGRVAAVDAAAARENLRKALELTDAAREVTVKVHPSQLAALETCLPALADALARTGAVRLVGDEGVSPGGVRLSSGRGEIDATIETQLANIAEALVGPSAAPAEPGRYERAGRADAAGETKQPVFLPAAAEPAQDGAP